MMIYVLVDQCTINSYQHTRDEKYCLIDCVLIRKKLKLPVFALHVSATAFS